MSNVIDFLEQAGRSAYGIDAVLASVAPGVETRQTLLAADAHALAAACGARIALACYVSAPDHEPEPAECPDDVPDVPDEPDQQTSEVA